jgi:predicted XRE-type DNA-binding protein
MNRTASSKTTHAKLRSVWEVHTTSPQEAASFRVRAEMMMQIAFIVHMNGWTKSQAARRCRLTASRMSDLLAARSSCFAIDELLNISIAPGYKADVTVS